MKIIVGGGGVDKDGNSFSLPSETVEVPDDFFQKAIAEAARMPQPMTIPISGAFLKLLEDEIEDNNSRYGITDIHRGVK